LKATAIRFGVAFARVVLVVFVVFDVDDDGDGGSGRY
jgi:hypothetical protein